MKRFIKIAISAMMCMIIATGCSSKTIETPPQNSNPAQSASSQDMEKVIVKPVVAMGRYIENDLEAPDIVYAQYAKRKSTTLMFGINKDTVECYELVDESKWVKKDMPFDATDQWVPAYALDEQGLLHYISLDSEAKATLYRINEDGNAVVLPIKWQERPYGYANSLEVLPNGDFIIGNVFGVVEHYSSSGEMLNEFAGDFLFGADHLYTPIYENYVAVLDEKELNINLYDWETGEVSKTISYKDFHNGSRIGLCFDEDGALYVANGNGIGRISPNGEKIEILVEGDMTSMSMPSLYLNTIAMLDDNQFLCGFMDSTKGYKAVSKKYSYSATTPTRPENEIIVYTMNNSISLRQAASEYQLSDPSTKVTVRDVMQDESGATTADLIRVLNTEILAENGPDVFVLDTLPMQSYIDKGVLADLSDLVDFSALNENVATSFKTDTGIYGVPLRFDVPLMWASEDIISSVKTLKDLVIWKNANPDKDLYRDASWQELVNSLYPVCAPSLINNKQINKETLAVFLEYIKALEVTDKIPEEDRGFYTSSGNYMRSTFEMKNSVMYFAFGEMSAYFTGLQSLVFFSGPAASIDQRGSGGATLQPALAQNVYLPKHIMGINKNSKHMDIAKNFLNMALSDKVQSNDLDYLPVNKNSLDLYLNGELGNKDSIMSYSVSVDDGIDRQLVIAYPTKKHFDELRRLVESIKTPSVPDNIFLGFILEEAPDYFTDVKSLDQTVDAIIARAKVYLTE